MDKLSYHGKTIECARWVVETYGTEEKREYYKGNKSIADWLEACFTILEAERISY